MIQQNVVNSPANDKGYQGCQKCAQLQIADQQTIEQTKCGADQRRNYKCHPDWQLQQIDHGNSQQGADCVDGADT